jgi:hypothetical protein
MKQVQANQEKEGFHAPRTFFGESSSLQPFLTLQKLSRGAQTRKSIAKEIVDGPRMFYTYSNRYQQED